MPTPDFRFEVDESCDITHRGVAVFGRLISGSTATGEALCLLVGEEALRINDASVEFALRNAGDELAFLLPGFSKDQVPPGSVLMSWPTEGHESA